VGIYLLVAIMPSALSGRPLRVTDLAIANSVQWISHALIMLKLMRQRLGGLHGFGLRRLTLKAIAGSLTMAAGAWLTMTMLMALPGEQSTAREALNVIGAAAFGAVIYIGLMRLMRTPEIGLIGQIIRRRRIA
jgi:putative peptidoglycan lipid II flippase